jgi:hypothetical protein
MATWQDVRRFALALPETVERSPRDFRVKDKLVAWERPLRKADLAVLGDAAPTGPILGAWVSDLETKDARITVRADVFFTTPHFDGYPIVLVKLAAISKQDLRKLIVDAWLARAPKRLAKAFREGDTAKVIEPRRTAKAAKSTRVSRRTRAESASKSSNGVTQKRAERARQ